MVLVAFVVACVSCKKEDPETDIVGKWQSVTYSRQVYEAGKLVDDESASCIDWYLGFEFKSDGSGKYISYEGNSVFTQGLTWVIMGDKLMVTLPEAPSEDNSVAFDIVSISKDSMVLSEIDEYTSDGLRCKEVYTYNFKKI